MAIEVYCSNCFTSNKMEAKKCSKCGTAFGRDKTYRVRVQVKGRRVSRVVDNLTIAREVEAALKGDLVRDEFEIAAHRVQELPTLDDVWAKYLPWCREHKRSWKDDEWNYNRHLKPRFGTKPLESISALDIERMKLELKKATNKNGKPFRAATIKHQIVLLRRLFNLAAKWRIHSGPNPVSSVELPKLDNMKTEYLSDDELDRLRSVLDAWPCRITASLVRFAMLTGLRRGELFRLEWTDLDFEHGLVTLRAPKGGKTQTIPISSEGIDLISRMTRLSEHVFPNMDGTPRKSIRDPWESIKRKAELPADFRFHGLRHSWASRMVSSGIDLAVVQGLMTHKHASTTERYAHLMPNALKRAAEASADIMRPKHGQVLKIMK
ncbi:MAG TPA: tyrosine-type recombinase/integrase [Syntrophobacteraceae bacterium]|nr:tyrosine-type recombinase/integrase [Syntrophobacteraceae bacterium]